MSKATVWRVVRLLWLGVGLIVVVHTYQPPTAKACSTCRQGICYYAEAGGAYCDFTSGVCRQAGTCEL